MADFILFVAGRLLEKTVKCEGGAVEELKMLIMREYARVDFHLL